MKCLSFSLYKPYHHLSPFDFLVSLFASIPFIPLFCHHLSLCFSLIYSVHGNSRVRSCCFGAPVHWWISATLNSIQLLQTCPWILFSLCPRFFISSHCTSILLLAPPHVRICHNLLTPQTFYLSSFLGGKMSYLPPLHPPVYPLSSLQFHSPDAECHMPVDHMCTSRPNKEEFPERKKE